MVTWGKNLVTDQYIKKENWNEKKKKFPEFHVHLIKQTWGSLSSQISIIIIQKTPSGCFQMLGQGRRKDDEGKVRAGADPLHWCDAFIKLKKLKNSSVKSSKKCEKTIFFPGGGSEVRTAGSYNNATTRAGDGDITRRIHDKDPEIQSYPWSTLANTEEGQVWTTGMRPTAVEHIWRSAGEEPLKSFLYVNLIVGCRLRYSAHSRGLCHTGDRRSPSNSRCPLPAPHKP